MNVINNELERIPMHINSHISANIGVKIVHCQKLDTPLSPDYQFYFIQKGSVIIKRNHDEQLLQKDDIIMLKPDEVFTISPSSLNTIIGVRIDNTYISSLIPIGYDMECDSTKETKKKYEPLIKIMIEICTSFYEDHNETKMAGLILHLSDYLKRNCIHPIPQFHQTELDARNQERINEIIQIIKTHYAQPLSLSSLAEKMYFTPQYLSKFIKKNLGESFSHYLTHIRLQYAHTELIQTENSIIEIAFNNGFPNIASFNKAFREKYNCSPSTYKQQYLSKKPNRQLGDNSNHYLMELTPEHVFQTTINVDAAKPISYHAPWNDTINIGVLYNALSTNFQDSFRHYVTRMPVTYVRFENLFSSQIYTCDLEKGVFDFTNLTDAFDFFYSLHVYPFIDLTPKQSKNEITEFSLNEPIIDTEMGRDNAHYCQILQEIIRYSMQVYGTEYVSKWRFEITAIHDEYLNYTEVPLHYVQRYQAFYQLIKGFDLPCKIGGLGFNICSNIRTFQSYLEEFQKKRIRFDFISLYAYNYETNSQTNHDDPLSHGILSPDKDYIYHNFSRYQDKIKESIYSDLPIYITDFGSTLTIQNYIYDSMYQADFIVKTFLNLFEHCPCIAYRSFWDTIPSLSFLKDAYYSNSSLISKKRIPKPSLHVYTMLSRLGANLIAYNDKYIMTCSSANNYQLLLFHYVHYKKNFCFNSWDPVRLENTYEIFEDCEPLQIHFVCNTIPSGRYKVTQLSLNRNYGSALDKYLRILDYGNTTSTELLSTILNFTEEEAAYYRHTCVPRHDIYHISCQEQLELDVKLAPHDILFFEFTKMI